MKYYASEENTYFTKSEALEKIKEVIENEYDGCYCDLHNEVFNMDYYIIGYAEAEKALEEYGIFKAIGVVVYYEKENFGEINTDISNPEKLANMLWYIIGEKAIAELDSVTNPDRWNYYADEDSNEEVLAEINKLLG